MKWPRDYLNAYAAKLLADRPDPPRNVPVTDLLKMYVFLVALLPFAAGLIVVGFVARQPALVALFLLLVIGFGLAGLSRLITTTRWALRFGVAAPGQVTSVTKGYRGARVTTVRVDGPNGPVDTTLLRPDDQYVQGDVVQVMVDPETRQVVLMLALLKPSPLYAPPPA